MTRHPGARVIALALVGALLLGGLAGAAGPAPTTPAIAGVPAVPTGWNSWNAFGCDVDQAKIQATADALVSLGSRAAGYRYVVVDDCWVASTRDSHGRLRADRSRFPDGMAALAQYVHARGLRFGLYTSATSRTCAQRAGTWPGSTGSEGHEALDAATFASWGVDLVKDDWCAGEMAAGRQRAFFAAFRDGIVATGRPIALMINPNSGITTGVPGFDEDWAGIATTVRITNDVTNVWRTPGSRLTSRGISQEVAAAEFSVRARWGPVIRQDADMLWTGAAGLTEAEQRTQLGMLAFLGLPLFLGDDVTSMSASTRALVGDPRIVDLATAARGRPRRLPDRDGVHLWVRRIDGVTSLALYNPGPRRVVVDIGDVLGDGATDLWTGAVRSTTRVVVSAHDTVLLRAGSS